VELFALIEVFGKFLDLAGVIVIVVGVIYSSILFVRDWLNNMQISHDRVYRAYRQNLGKVILLGLEFLVAGDIVRTVAGEPTFTSVGVLAIIVIIRTFLSITFEMEVDGHWPWQKSKRDL
jgi:uncharacterized membrane protein